MSGLATLAVAGVAVGAAGLAGIAWPAPARLAPRVRPYTIVARTRLGGVVDPGELDPIAPADVWARWLGVSGRALTTRLARLVAVEDDRTLRLRLVQAGRHAVTPDQERVRRLRAACLGAGGFGLAGSVLVPVPLVVGALVALGALQGAARARAGLDRAVATRAERLRQELYTVNQLLAIHLRTGAGPRQAIGRIVQRGRGVVVEELDAILRRIRAGASDAQAFAAAAEITPDPGAARTYRLFAASAERGADLADALLALSDDLREARRQEMRQSAVRRRAAMLLPVIGILAPIMLLFIAAPLPGIVLGHR